MASPVIAEEFLDTLAKSRLLGKGDIDRFVESRDLHNASPNEIARHLVKDERLTLFQARRLLQGMWRGLVINGYRVIEPLGQGGMGWVYIAEDPDGMKVAIKVLAERYRSNQSMFSRFQLEAHAGMSLAHPNLLRTLAIEKAEDRYGIVHFVVMELVQGVNLHELFAVQKSVPWQQACDFVMQAARGLHHAHENGFIHRDVKPENILIRENGVAKVLDFGLALTNQEEAEFSMAMIHGQDKLGTADYVAPEQAENSFQVDRRADVYGLGCTLYFALTGQVPFPAGSTREKIEAHRKKHPVDVTDLNPEVPARVQKILRKMMAKRPENRFSTCEEAADLLEPVTTRLPVKFDFRALLRARARLARSQRTDSGSMSRDSVAQAADTEGQSSESITGSKDFTSTSSVGEFKNGDSSPQPSDSFSDSLGSSVNSPDSSANESHASADAPPAIAADASESAELPLNDIVPPGPLNEARETIRIANELAALLGVTATDLKAQLSQIASDWENTEKLLLHKSQLEAKVVASRKKRKYLEGLVRQKAAEVEQLVGELEQVAGDVSSLRESDQAARGRCETQQQELDKLTAVVDQQAGELAAAQEQLASLADEFAALTTEFSTLTDERAALTDELASAKQSAHEAAERIVTEESRRHELEALLAENKTQLATAAAALAESEANARQLIETSEARTAELESHRIESEAELTRLRSHQQETDESLAAANATIAAFESARSADAEKIAELERQLSASHEENGEARDAASTQVQSIQAELDEACAARETTLAQVRELDQQLQTLRQKFDGAQDQAAERSAEIERLQSDLTDAREREHTIDAARIRAEETSADLASQVDSVVAQLADVHRQRELADHACAESANESTELAGQVEALQAELTDERQRAEAELTETQQQFESQLADERQRAEAELTETQQQFESQSAEMQQQFESQLADERQRADVELSQSRQQFYSESAELRKRVELLESARSQAEQSAAGFAANVERLQETIAAHEQAVRNAGRETARLDQQSADAKDEIDRLQAALEQSQQQAEEYGSTIESLRQDLQNAVDERTRTAEEIAVLRTKLMATQEERDHVTETHEAAGREQKTAVEELTAQVESLRSELASSQAAECAALDQLEKEREQREQFEVRSEAAEQSRRELEVAAERKDQELDELIGQIATLRSELTDEPAGDPVRVSDQLDTVRQQIEQKDHELHEHQATIAELQQELKLAVDSLDDARRSASIELQEKMDAIVQLEAELSSREVQETRATPDSVEMPVESTVEELRERFEAERLKRKTVEKRLATTTERAKLIMEKYSELKEHSRALAKKATSRREKAEEILERLNREKAQRKSSEEARAQLQAELDSLRES